MNLLHKLKYRFSEPYRIRIGCGLSPIRNKREMKALIDFCKNTLEEEYMQKYNTKKRNILKKTIILYDNKDYVALYQYVDDHLGWYWS